MLNLPDYGRWDLVLTHAAIMLLFVVSFFRPQTKRDWRTFGVFSAFLIALFTEMYGFPLTVFSAVKLAWQQISGYRLVFP